MGAVGIEPTMPEGRLLYRQLPHLVELHPWRKMNESNVHRFYPDGFQDRCNTIMRIFRVVRLARFELALASLKAKVPSPLEDNPNAQCFRFYNALGLRGHISVMASPQGIEPRFTPSKGGVLPIRR